MSHKENKGELKRRDFLKLIGVVSGGAAISSCWSQPADEIIPYVIPPDDVIPGVPKWYSSTCQECPAGCGVIVKNMDGRAIKVEGNPLNPINTGSLCARGQSSLQGQYNPDRFRSPYYKNDKDKLEPIGWENAENRFAEILNKLISEGKTENIVFLTNNISGSLDHFVKQWLSTIGGGEHIVYEAISYESIKEANRLSFGINKVPSYKLENADYILSFGADFLETWISPVQYSKQFSKMHGFDNEKMGKCVYVSPRLSLTGANADSWVSIKPGSEIYLALGLIKEILDMGLSNAGNISGISTLVNNYSIEKVSKATDISVKNIKQIAAEFAKSKSSIAIGGSLSCATTNATKTLAAINLLNYVAGNLNNIINFNSSQSIGMAASFDDLESLVDKMNKGQVYLLITYNVNPVYSLPKVLGFESALKNVSNIVSFSTYPDETTRYADLILPDSSSLETWGDYSPQEGVYSIIQPAMSPIYNTKPLGDSMLSIYRQLELSSVNLNYKNYYDYLRDSWRNIHALSNSAKAFDDFWKESLEKGGYFNIPDTSQVTLSNRIFSIDIDNAVFEHNDEEYYFVPFPSIKYYDGRGANRPWLQELPDPLTTSVWDSWAEIHPDTASRLGVVEGDYLSIQTDHGVIETQAFIFKGIRKDTVAVSLGQGHNNIGQFGDGRGVNILEIIPAKKDNLSGALAWLSTKVKISKTGKRSKLVKVQYTFSQDDRKIAQSISLKNAMNGDHDNKHLSNGDGKNKHENNDHHANLTMYPAQDYFSYKWGMSIDLSKCIGCGACVTACYAENNVSFVGKEQVSRGRYMGWIKIERFFEEENNNFKTKFIPMLCQHCDNAPCEPVCPVYATYHNYEGLNVMVYNRCVGTRYCSNNCTYKVRKFNWFDYKLPEPLNLQLNPDVTVREKGIMEKCTFCSQRIIYAKDKARDENRKVRDGEIKPACVQTCPSEALAFGDMKNHDSEVYKKSEYSRSYRVLEEINTLPSIHYLKKVERDEA